jgi:hypothetical protein
MASQNNDPARSITQLQETDIIETKIAESATSTANEYNDNTDGDESIPNTSQIAEKMGPHEVTWDSDHDQQNPRNWPKWKKWYISI